MKAAVIERNGIRVAEVTTEVPMITDAASAMKLIMTVRYETGASRIVMNKALVCREFFILRHPTGRGDPAEMQQLPDKAGYLRGLQRLYQQAAA